MSSEIMHTDFVEFPVKYHDIKKLGKFHNDPI